VQVLLVVVLGVVEGRGLAGLGGDLPVAGRVKLVLVGVPGGLGLLLMAERYWVPASLPWRMPWVGSWFSQKILSSCS
jgi:hypothetical protein